LAGDYSACIRRVLLTIDLTEAVVDAAIGGRIDLIMAYHPPIFKPISALRVPSTGTDAAVHRCIRNGLAIYATHTALDAADGGTNDVLAALCGVRKAEPIEYVDDPSHKEFKLVVFVPPAEADGVADAMFAAGAGHIGNYSRCGFRLEGKGSFFGGECTHPTIGERGRTEYVDEFRLETVVSAGVLPAVIRAMTAVHSYEEPAFDIYPLKARPVRGTGRWGALAQPTTLGRLARKLKRVTHATSVQMVGPADREITRAAVQAGAAGSMPFRLPLTSEDVIVTGEIRHHDALTIERLGCAAIALGHWASERPALASLVMRLESELPGVSVTISAADRDPFQAV
jgi:dinuclear metal center YbgI/SA1388 family protein